MARRWKIIERGRVPDRGITDIDYDCPRCGRGALMPVMGCAIAQIGGGGVVFDPHGDHAVPTVIQCPWCRRRFEAA